MLRISGFFILRINTIKMRFLKRMGRGIYLLAGTVVFFGWTAPALADTLVSPHYQFTEQSLGASGLYGSQSANYQTEQALGILGLSTSASSNLQIQAGNVTTGDPSLTFSVNSTSVDFGYFSATSASTTTATFQVLDYSSYGYIVQIYGNAPSHNGTQITPMATAGPSVPGTNQFGINVVANTSPSSLGANPNNGQFGYGQAASGYNTSNSYKYVSSDVIAQGPKSSGTTIYTISYIINVNELSAGGSYSGSQTLICTPTY
jgi:hypothetical protein